MNHDPRCHDPLPAPGPVRGRAAGDGVLGGMAQVRTMDFTPSIAFAPIPQPSTYRLVRVSADPPLESVALIQRIVAEAFGVPAWTMTARDRQEHIARPRMIAMSIVRDLTRLSTTSIGKEFGGRDHGTVLHACKQVENWASVEAGLGEKIEELKQRCRRGQ